MIVRMARMSSVLCVAMVTSDIPMQSYKFLNLEWIHSTIFVDTSFRVQEVNIIKCSLKYIGCWNTVMWTAVHWIGKYLNPGRRKSLLYSIASDCCRKSAAGEQHKTDNQKIPALFFLTHCSEIELRIHCCFEENKKRLKKSAENNTMRGVFLLKTGR